jgi:hypothetical protein
MEPLTVTEALPEKSLKIRWGRAVVPTGGQFMAEN